MSKHENERERRKQQRLERLGTNDPRCSVCGETRWYCFDGHHVAGRRYDDTVTPLCLNCHAEQSEAQKDHPALVFTPPDRLERIGHFLLGLADLLEGVIRKLREFGRQLIEEARNSVGLPVRAPYGGEQYTIGLNELTSDKPLWYTLADCIASTLLTGKPPKVLRAIVFEPGEPQDNMKSIHLFGESTYNVDLRTQDFYRRLIQLRIAVKRQMETANKSKRDALDAEQQVLKILASATSYGIFVELNVEELRESETAQCFGAHERPFQVKIDKAETPGSYFHPLLGTLITGAARLMLAIAERLILNAGLDWAFCDTDSIAIATPAGMSDQEFLGRAEKVREWFTPLNPYGEAKSLLRVEDANYALKNGKRAKTLRPLFCFAVSAKRYALFNVDPHGMPVLRKVSAHGLGHLIAPYEEKDALSTIPRPAISLDEMGVERWQHDFWHLIIQSELWDGKARPDFSILPSFNRPAASRYAATTPHLLRWFKAYNEGKLRAKQVWPFNFMLAFQAKRLMEWEPEKEVAPRSRNRLPDLPRAVAPYHKDISVAARNCFDRETDARIPPEQLKTFLDALGRYDLHPEPKFLFGDYRDRGATKRRHVVVTEVRNIGKEANRWEEQFYLGAEPEAQIVYGSAPQEERQVCARLQEAMERHRVTAIAEASGLSRKHIYAIAKRKTRPSAEALNKLNRALDQLS